MGDEWYTLCVVTDGEETVIGRFSTFIKAAAALEERLLTERTKKEQHEYRIERGSDYDTESNDYGTSKQVWTYNAT